MNLKKQATSLRMSNAWKVAKKFGLKHLTKACFDVKNALKVGIVKLTFQKVDGTISEHIGTKLDTLIPIEKTPKGVRESNENTMTFFSLSADGWRSVSANLLNTVKWSFV